MTGNDGRDARQTKGRDPQRVPVELLVLGYIGFVLLLAGAALGTDRGELLANLGLLITIGAALFFFARGIAAWRWRE